MKKHRYNLKLHEYIGSIQKELENTKSDLKDAKKIPRECKKDFCRFCIMKVLKHICE